MPPLIAAAAATLATAFTTGFAGVVGFSALTSGAALTFFAINSALGYALNALTPKISQSSAGQSYQGNFVDSVADHQIIYGETKVGGVVVYKNVTTGNSQLHSVIAFSGHQIESFTEIYLNDELLTINPTTGNVTLPAKYSGFVRIKTHDGDPNQVADSDLVSESGGQWTSAHRLRGISYIYARLTFDADVFPNGEPVITAVIKGKKIYDPRSGLTAWSDNSALCLADYIVSKQGLSENSLVIDYTLVSAAANICDESVSLLLGGTEKRYTTNGAFVTSVAPVGVIDSLLRCMGGMIWFAQGKWRMKAAAWTSPVIAFDEDDFRSEINITTRNSRRDNFNCIGGKFRGPETNWSESDFPKLISQTFITADGGLESSISIDLLFTRTSSTAQRIAKIALYRNREQITVSATFGLRALNVQTGDIISLTLARAGWTSKTFEVQSWRFAPTSDNDLQIEMTLREISSSVFNWAAEESAFESNNTDLVSPFYVVPIGLELSSEVRVFRESLTNVIIASVTASDPSGIERIEVQGKKSVDTIWTPVGTGQLGTYEYISVDDSYYDIRARAWNFLAVKSDWTQISNFIVAGLAEPPQDVQSFSANVNGSSLNLTWTAVTDLDLSYYKIRYATEVSGASYSNSTTAVAKVSRPASSVTVPTRPGTYTIKAYDKTGNASTLYNSVSVPPESLESFANQTLSTQSPGFAGAKTNSSVTSSELRLTTYSSPNAVGIYEFTGSIDTLSPRKVRCRVDIAVNRFANASGLWDDMSGLWDSWSGLWDDWTGAVQLADTDVVSYISITQTDPAGSPVWSSWQPFTSGDFYGRAFKFKIELSSETSDVTPSISSLIARVQY